MKKQAEKEEARDNQTTMRGRYHERMLLGPQHNLHTHQLENNVDVRWWQ